MYATAPNAMTAAAAANTPTTIASSLWVVGHAMLTDRPATALTVAAAIAVSVVRPTPSTAALPRMRRVISTIGMAAPTIPIELPRASAPTTKFVGTTSASTIWATAARRELPATPMHAT